MAVQTLHGAPAVWQEAVPVVEAFRRAEVWRGAVQVFRRSDGILVYAWESPTGSDGMRTYAVLGVGPISSAADAVRASIVADFKRGKT